MRTVFVVMADGVPIAVGEIEFDAEMKVREFYDRTNVYYVEVPIVPEDVTVEGGQ